MSFSLFFLNYSWLILLVLAISSDVEVKIEEHYSNDYFEWQKSIGYIGGKLNLFKFNALNIHEDDILLDFGCGGGFLLNNFNVKEKVCVEINPTAQITARGFNIDVHNSLETIPTESITKIISNHALEHTAHPLNILTELHRVLKANGEIIIVVPCEQSHEKLFHYDADDINKHLYTWTPMSLGNLASRGGFEIVDSYGFHHSWPPDFKDTYQNDNFHDRCIQYAQDNQIVQVLLHARKKSK